MDLRQMIESLREAVGDKSTDGVRFSFGSHEGEFFWELVIEPTLDRRHRRTRPRFHEAGDTAEEVYDSVMHQIVRWKDPTIKEKEDRIRSFETLRDEGALTQEQFERCVEKVRAGK